jgi:hypothetical protein
MMLKKKVIIMATLGGVVVVALVACATTPDAGLEEAMAASDAVEAVAEIQVEAADAAAESDADADSGEDIVIAVNDAVPEALQWLVWDWNTDWDQHTIPLEELWSGGVPRDGIPALTDPELESVEQAASWLPDTEPVIALEIEGEAHAYPLRILVWHEIVNDTVGGTPAVVAFCPLCNASVAFDRRVNGEVFEFGVSGLLRNSDMVMYDRTTESLWQQFTGEGIVGEMAGEQLTFLPASVVSFAQFSDAFPDGQVLSQETGYLRLYGENPYPFYDSDEEPFLFRGDLDRRLPAMMRVVAVSVNDVAIAYPYDVLAEVGVINDVQSGQALAVFHALGVNSALDALVISEAEDIGGTGVFNPNLDGQQLTFQREGDGIVDDQTGSEWNILGQAVDGPLSGQRLEPIVHADHFWFAWAAFEPDTLIYGVE